MLSGCITSPGSPQEVIKTGAVSATGSGRDNLSDIIPLFDTYAEQTFERSGVPGMAIAIVKNDSVVYQRCFGVKNITTQDPVTPDTRFQLASISKSFTTATIASMVGNGELSWNDTIASWYPEFRLSDPWITEHITRFSALKFLEPEFSFNPWKISDRCVKCTILHRHSNTHRRAHLEMVPLLSTTKIMN